MLTFQNYGEDRKNVVSVVIHGDSDARHPHKFNCFVRDENHESLSLNSATSVVLDEWIHMACVFKRDDVDITLGAEDGYDDEELLLYVNGELEDYAHKQLQGIRTGGGSPILLGAHGWVSDTAANDGSKRESFSNRFVGRMAEFKYWDVPLSGYELQRGMFLAPDKADIHLLAYSDFTGFTTSETSGEQHHLQLKIHDALGAVVDMPPGSQHEAALRTVTIRGDCTTGAKNIQSSLACPVRLSEYPSGRIEVFHEKVGWGTVCGHAYCKLIFLFTVLYF